MENVNWLKLKLNEKMMNLQSSKANINADLSSNNAVTKNLIQQTQNNIINQVQNQIVNPQQLRMNNLASIDRAVYVKNLLNLPKNMVELLVMVQNEGKNQTQQAQNQQQPTNPQNPQNVLNQAQNQPQNAQNLQQNALNQIPNRQQNTQNNQNVVQQPNVPVQNQNTNTNLQKLPVMQANPQVQPPEQQQIQNQTQQVKEQKPNYQQQNQNSHTPEKTNENVPQKQIQANKEAFTQQMNNAKQEASTQINKQVQTNQPQVAQNQQQLQQQNVNRPQVQQPTMQQPQQQSVAQQPVAQQPTVQQPQQQPVSNQPVQQQPTMQQPQIQQPVAQQPAVQQPQQQPVSNQPVQQQPTMQQPQIQQPVAQQPAVQQPAVQQPQQQPALNQPVQQQTVQQHNNLPINEGQKQIHVNQQPRNEINRTIQNEHFNNVENKSNQHNNLRQDLLQNDRMPILDKGEKFIQNTKQNVQQNALFGPHNQLHNNIRNSVRQPIIFHQPPKPPTDIENLEQMQANNLQKTQGMTAEELAQFKQKMAAQLSENVNLTSVSALLQKNSKLAMNKMVSMMTLATAQGMTDIKPLQDTVNIINASVAATSQNDATQTLKNLMLLYLPWLPLQEGVGFDLEIEQDEDLPESDTFIKIMITTINFGNLNATVSLITGNSVDIAITCSEKFPKKELFKRLSKDGSQHSMQTAIDIKEQKPQEQIETQNAKAKVNLANVNQVNPYLLLMAHAIIRHTIELDATISIGKQPIEDN